MTKVSGGIGGFRVEGDRSAATVERLEQLEPFLVSVISATDLWMFATSNGGITAGRVEPSGAIFAYETVDRLYERPGRVGPVTYLRDGAAAVWAPLGTLGDWLGHERSLTKSALGDELSFRELSPDGAWAFRCSFRPSGRFGWVRTVEITNLDARTRTIDALDGFLDVLPAQVGLTSQQRASNLVDAYRHTELHPERMDLALYGLSSLLTDRVEPAEALRANAVWRVGPAGAVSLDPRAVKSWWRREPIAAVRHLRGRKGAYLFHHEAAVEPGASLRWRTVMDAGLDHRALSELSTVLLGGDAEAKVEQDLEASRRRLVELAASIDGFQRSGSGPADLNHLSNAMFNGLRGGFVLDGGRIPRREVERVVEERHRGLLERHSGFLAALGDPVEPEFLREQAALSGDPQLSRLCDEVVPLAYGRRHGDPSRPWNQFAIRVRDEEGRPRLGYEGNWRDIFQNWEALALGYPEYLQSFIAKFVNAMTRDGYNPYRVSDQGVDWEVPDPHDPWSNIGYWGDHQIIYLLRLLEALERYRPELLSELLDAQRFSFADVPYRIADFDAMLADPFETIAFDEAHAAVVEGRVSSVGTDGRLVFAHGQVLLTHLWEKLLIILMAKISNLVPEGGIWMNTQRPEWNDANNALPGRGLSVVTLAHALRLVRFLSPLAERRTAPLELSEELASWVAEVKDGLAEAVSEPGGSAARRRSLLERWGHAFSAYRAKVYEGHAGGGRTLPASELLAILRDAEQVLTRSFWANQREDGLFHAYNTLSFDGDRAEIGRLPLMLEGQVAALDSGVLGAREAVQLTDQLFASPLFRADQGSFLLYPDKVLPDLESRNVVPEARAQAIPAVRAWIAERNRSVLYRDEGGILRFSPDLHNAKALAERLDRAAVGAAEKAQVLDLYELTFGHREFTGRSQGMYGFEGLGCIYWHMAAKLLLNLAEALELAEGPDARGAPGGEHSDRAALLERYLRVRAGFNFKKSPLEYGAFPTDAYSHTPGHSGAQQPGMTGQVKEQLLARFKELGVRIREGRLHFEAPWVPADERPQEAALWTPPGSSQPLEVPAGGLGFFYAGVFVVLRPGSTSPSIRLSFESGEIRVVPGSQLDAQTTRLWLSRSGAIAAVLVDLSEAK